MSKLNEEELMELKMEMIQEAKEEELYEKNMHGDIDFAMEQICNEPMEELSSILDVLVQRMESYGHNVDKNFLINSYI